MTHFKKPMLLSWEAASPAWQLPIIWSKKASQKKLPLTITLLEREKQLGGKIKTQRQDGFIIEQGPDSFRGATGRDSTISGAGLGQSVGAHRPFGQPHLYCASG